MQRMIMVLARVPFECIHIVQNSRSTLPFNSVNIASSSYAHRRLPRIQTSLKNPRRAGVSPAITSSFMHGFGSWNRIDW